MILEEVSRLLLAQVIKYESIDLPKLLSVSWSGSGGGRGIQKPTYPVVHVR